MMESSPTTNNIEKTLSLLRLFRGVFLTGFLVLSIGQCVFLLEKKRRIISLSSSSSRELGSSDNNNYGTYDVVDDTHSFFSNNDGDLSIIPTHHKQCTTIRIRGDERNLTVDDAIELLRQQAGNVTPGTKLTIGIEIMEMLEKFLPVRIREDGNHNYHMYHFVEMIVIAYAELQRISEALQQTTTTTSHNNSNNVYPTISRGSVTVPWILSPYMSPSELCGTPTPINCLIADMTFKASNYSIFQNKSGIYGLDEMENHIYENTHKARKEKAVTRRIQLANDVYGKTNEASKKNNNNNNVLTKHTDAVILIDRFGCDRQSINKPWASYIDNFPAYKWHSDIMHGLGVNDDNLLANKPKTKIVVGYIDRQNTDRRMPDEQHEWLINYLNTIEYVEFLHLHMENYNSIEQINIATKCDILIGIHGNGLTHSLWMKPQRYVIELFWLYPFQYDYATTAQLMKHKYLGIVNGKVLNNDLIQHRDPLLRKLKQETIKADVKDSSRCFEVFAKPTIQKFIYQAAKELLLLPDNNNNYNVNFQDDSLLELPHNSSVNCTFPF